MSRAKGANAELEVCRMLEEWWGEYEPGCQFHRTPRSGGWANPKARGEFGTAGDLVTTAKHFPFAVEVKRREGWALKNVIAGGRSPVWGWWRQAVEAAGEMGKVPLLVFRKSREPWRVMIGVEAAYWYPKAHVWFPNDEQVVMLWHIFAQCLPYHYAAKKEEGEHEA